MWQQTTTAMTKTIIAITRCHVRACACLLAVNAAVDGFEGIVDVTHNDLDRRHLNRHHPSPLPPPPRQQAGSELDAGCRSVR